MSGRRSFEGWLGCCWDGEESGSSMGGSTFGRASWPGVRSSRHLSALTADRPSTATHQLSLSLQARLPLVDC